MTNLERMWGYLHDNPECVNPNLFVTDPYRYVSDFIDLIAKSPEDLYMLRSKIKGEKLSYQGLFYYLRGKRGFSELRVIKMKKVSAFKEIMNREFGEFGEDEVKLVRR